MSSRRTTDSSRPTPEQISLWVIEDDELFRNTLVGVLNSTPGMKCAHAFSSCEDALELLRGEFAPEVVLMDIQLPGMSGIEGLRHIKSISPATDIVMLTIFEEEEKIFRAICAGANGYLLKSSPSEEIIRAIQEVLGGGAPMNAQIARRVLDMFSNLTTPRGDYNLTDREKDILRFMTDGLTKKHIAEKLFLSYFTIDTHIKNIYTKLQVHTRTGAVAKVLKEHLLSLLITVSLSLLPTMS